MLQKTVFLRKNIFLLFIFEGKQFYFNVFLWTKISLSAATENVSKKYFLSLMQNCFRKYLKIIKIIKGSQRNFPLENNFWFLEKRHHLIENCLPSSCLNIWKKAKEKTFSTQYCLTRLPLNFEKILHSGRNALVQVH